MTPEQTLPRPSRDSGSHTEMETWSFDRAINEVFRLLPPELFPRSSEEHAPAKPFGIEQLMESQSTPLLILPQSNLIENTARFLQDKIDSEKCGRDWVCSQNLVLSLTQTKFYKNQSQYFPTDNIPLLESEASLLDLSNKGKFSIPMKNLEIWEKRARKLIAINSHVDLFSSAAYLCKQQQTMFVQALSRLLESVAKSIRHATAMSMILATEIFQARRDAVLATSKVLLENSSHELRNAPINSKTLFGNKIKEVAKANFEAQQQRFLATSSVATTMQQQQKVT